MKKLIALVAACLYSTAAIAQPAGLTAVEVANVATLQASSFGAYVHLQGSLKPGDGSDGYYAQNGFVCTPDGFSIIKDKAGHCYFRGVAPSAAAILFSGVPDDTTNNSPALNAAMVAGANAGLPVAFANNAGKLKFLSQITWDVSKTSLNCNGAFMDWTAATGVGSSAFLMFSTATDPNQVSMLATVHPTKDCYLDGPDGANGFDIFHFTPDIISGTPWMTGIVIDGVNANGFRNYIQTSDGMVFLQISHATFGARSASSRVFLDSVGSTNAGENYALNDIFVSNAQACFNDHGGNPNVDIFATAFSCDGTNYVVTGGVTPGLSQSSMSINYSGHIENTQVSGSYPIDIVNGTFNFHDGFFVGTNLLSHVFCRVSTIAGSSGGAEGIVFDRIQFSDVSGTFVPSADPLWCDGAGKFRVVNSGVLGNTGILLTSAGNNLVPNYTSPQISNWSISGTVTIDGATHPTGATATLKFAPVAGTDAQAFIQVGCKPGDIPGVYSQLQTTGVTAAGASGEMDYQFIDYAGDILGVNSFNFSADIASWAAHTVVAVQQSAPSGTAFCRILYKMHTPGGAPLVWVAFPELVVQ